MVVFVFVADVANAQVPFCLEQKISNTFVLQDGVGFGYAVASIDDLDGNGVNELVVGVPGVDSGPYLQNLGEVTVLFLDADGTVMSHQTWGMPVDPDLVEPGDAFGSTVASIGDIDDDGVADIAVGMPNDDEQNTDQGTVWIIFLNSDGSMDFPAKITMGRSNFGGILNMDDRFGEAVTSVGDLDGDGVEDIAVGATDAANDYRGAVWVIFLTNTGWVKSYQKISDTEGNFTGMLDLGDSFGSSLALLGDLDGDGVKDIAVGATGDEDGGYDRGAVWIVFLNSDGTVKSQQKISDTSGNFNGTLDNYDFFGSSVASLGDLDGDSVGDIVVGARADDDGGDARGAVWVLFLNSDGTVKGHQKISDTEGNFSGVLDDQDFFGISVTSLGDLDGNGVNDLGIGASGDDDGGASRGAVWELLLGECLVTYDAFPVIQSIVDIPNDQGKQVRISWSRSAYDLVGSATPITSYSIYRRVDYSFSSGEPNGRRRIRSVAGPPEPYNTPPGDWDYIGVVPARQEDRYSIVAPTIADSTVTQGMYYSTFFISALTDTQWVYFDSPPDSGYSLDNLSPHVPTGLAVAYNAGVGNALSWDAPADVDFQHFNIYRGDGPDFEPSVASLVHATEGTGWIDPVADGWKYVYKLTAVDEAGNESVPASADAVTGTRGTAPPIAFGLYQNVPNPFNPVTTIQFDVPQPTTVRLSVFNVNGQLVRTLANRPFESGRQQVQWDGRDNHGRDVASGIYIYRIVAPGFTDSRKMILLK